MMWEYPLVLAVGLAAGTLSGVIGTGAAIILIPILAYQFGPKEAVPIMAIAAILANLARVMAWWREIDWRALAAYSATSIPAAALGARTLLVLPSGVVDAVIGLFLIGTIPLRRWLVAHNFKLTLWHLAIIGAVVGYITGIVITTGPITVSIFVSYGLVKGAFLATEAATALAVFVTKAVTFQSLGALPHDIVVKGVIIGLSLMAGAFLAKPLVVKLDPTTFRYLVDGMLLLSGLAMLWNAMQAGVF